MTVSLETIKTAKLVVVRGDVVVRGPFDAFERDLAERGVAITNEQLDSLGLEQDAQLAEVVETVSYGKPKLIQPDEPVSTDDTPDASPVIDPAGPAAASPSASPVTPPSAA